MKFKRLKDLREDNDKLQKEIANLLGISQQYYSEYEKGNRTITITHLMTLAKYYNTSIDYIVGLSDERYVIKNKPKKSYEGRIYFFMV
mgnify:CR=1 FL=1